MGVCSWNSDSYHSYVSWWRMIWLLVWITLTSPDNYPVYINTDGPQLIGKERGGALGRTMIILSGGNVVFVKETPEQVLKIFQDAKKAN